MSTQLRWLAALLFLFGLSITSMPVLAGSRLQPPHQEGTSTPELVPPLPAEIIEAVNHLRLQNLTPFNAGNFLRQNSTIVVALLISFSILVAGMVGFGKRKS